MGLLVILCFAMLPGLCGELKDLEVAVHAEIQTQPGVYGIAFQDLTTGDQVLINEDRIMHAASTMKTPVMMRLFEMMERNELSLQTEIVVKNQFKSIVDGSPFSLEHDPSEVLFQHLGQPRTVEQLITLMIIKSSNMATNILIEKARAKEVMRLMGDLNIEDIQVLRGVEDIKAYELGRNNQSSAKAMMRVMIACAQSPRFTPANREKMLEILRGQHYNEMIPGGIPKDADVKVAHKTGSISTVEHDAAVVDLPDGRRYALVIFISNFKDRSKAQAAGRRISGLFYQHMINQP